MKKLILMAFLITATTLSFAQTPKESPMITQERAYTSPIWYTP